METSTSRGERNATSAVKVGSKLCKAVLYTVFCVDKGKVDTFKKTGSEIGRQAATKSGGLFSADDWQCTM